jgi:hypothetical protein
METSKWAYLEYVKWAVEILALFVAGLWALKLYMETGIPEREKRVSIVSQLNWSDIAADKCLAEYTVTFKNVGKTDIELNSSTLKVWPAKEPGTTAAAKYLNPHELVKGNPIETAKLTDEEFSRHYAPDVGDTVTSSVVVKRDPGRILIFSLDFEQADSRAPHWLDYRWDYACDEPSANTVKLRAKQPSRRSR